MYLTLVSLFLMGRSRKSQEKGINNHLTTVSRQSEKDICMLWHSKSAMSKHHWYFFSLSYISMHSLLKRKIWKKNKIKKNQNILYMIASVSSRRCGSYKMYLGGDSLHQSVMIVCELNWFSHISNRHNMLTLMQSCNVFHTQHAIFFATFDTCTGIMWFGHHKECMC